MKAKTKNQEKQVESRRIFLQKTFMIGASVATVATLPTQVAASVEPLSKRTVKQGDGYRLSQHIAAYYKSTQL